MVIGDREVDLEENIWWLDMDHTENEYNTHHYERLKKLCLSDPVHTIVLKSYIESQVRILWMKIGNQLRNRADSFHS